MAMVGVSPGDYWSDGRKLRLQGMTSGDMETDRDSVRRKRAWAESVP